MSASDKTLLDKLNTRQHTTVNYAFGSIYLEKFGHVCMCGHWPTSIRAQITTYTYTGIIPSTYRPVSDVRLVAWDNESFGVQHLVQLTTSGNVIVTCNRVGNVSLHYSAAWATWID